MYIFSSYSFMIFLHLVLPCSIHFFPSICTFPILHIVFLFLKWIDMYDNCIHFSVTVENFFVEYSWLLLFLVPLWGWCWWLHSASRWTWILSLCGDCGHHQGLPPPIPQVAGSTLSPHHHLCASPYWRPVQQICSVPREYVLPGICAALWSSIESLIETPYK